VITGSNFPSETEREWGNLKKHDIEVCRRSYPITGKSVFPIIGLTGFNLIRTIQVKS